MDAGLVFIQNLDVAEFYIPHHRKYLFFPRVIVLCFTVTTFCHQCIEDVCSTVIGLMLKYSNMHLTFNNVA